VRICIKFKQIELRATKNTPSGNDTILNLTGEK